MYRSYDNPESLLLRIGTTRAQLAIKVRDIDHAHLDRHEPTTSNLLLLRTDHENEHIANN